MRERLLINWPVCGLFTIEDHVRGDRLAKPREDNVDYYQSVDILDLFNIVFLF